LGMSTLKGCSGGEGGSGGPGGKGGGGQGGHSIGVAYLGQVPSGLTTVTLGQGGVGGLGEMDLIGDSGVTADVLKFP
jgi:hypothetical protein